MRYRDTLYGLVDVSEPVLLDLIDSDAMCRLKGIAQHGITALLGITPPFSRFDHSVGTMLLVRRLNASIQEQIAALLHDVSHTAFSHVIDFVFNDHRTQSYHEEHKEAFFLRSDLPDILAHHGFDWHEFLEDSTFPLLEQPSPALCADRLDYFFRDLEFLGLASSAEISAAIRALVVRSGRIVVDSPAVARWLAYTFIETDRTSWSNLREVGLYQLTADAIKHALCNGVVSENDIWGTDAELWGKLRAANDPQVKGLVELLSPGTRFTRNDHAPIFTVATKVRSIDPPVIDKGNVSALSNIDSAFRDYRDQYLAEKQRAFPVCFIGPPAVASQ